VAFFLASSGQVMTRWLQGAVTENRRWTESLYSLRVDAPIEPFQAGQFIRLALDIDGERIGRPYSLVNAPHEPTLEVYSIVVPEGPLSPRLFGLQAGATVWVAPKASGFFTLAEVPVAENLWMLATGTALGPFLSILKTDEPWTRYKDIVLAHAVRTAPELTYGDLIKRLADRYPGRFRMVPFVSRERTDFAMPGRIPPAIDDRTLEVRAGLGIDAQRSQVMICGNPDMVRDTSEALQRRGLKKNRRKEPGQITTENYW
jgi:ferredoxin/flavodoxin---NADP+ reductase